MGVLYLPFFDVADFASGSLTITRSTFDSIPYTLRNVRANDADSQSSSIFQLHTFTQVTGNDSAATVRFRHFAGAGLYEALTVALRAIMVSSDWGAHHNFRIALDVETGKVTFSADVPFGVSFSNASTREMFGFASSVTQTASTYTGTYTPNYCIDCTLDAPSPGIGMIYEPDGLGTHAISDNGEGTVLARSEAPLYDDWVQQYESKLKTLRVGAYHGSNLAEDPSHPYSFQQLYEDSRRWGLPFVMRGTAVRAKVYVLRSDGMSFHPQRASDGNDTQFHIPFRCIDLGFAT